jgi:hypothetical protein
MSPKVIHEPLDPAVQDPRIQREVETLQALLSHGKVEEARRLARELEERWPDSDLARRFARVLAPPAARVVPGKKGLSREQTKQENYWLREHAREYVGHWVVLEGDRLIAAHPSLRAVMEEADRQVGAEIGTLHYIRAGTRDE